jgi:rubrerythrin
MTMPTLTPTYDTGATTMPIGGVVVQPERAVTESTLAAQAQVGDLNGPFVLGMLSQMLTHERCGRHLYRSVATRTQNPMLKRRYEQFGEETERHAARLEELITAIGGDPQYVSPAARAMEQSNSSLLESTFLGAGSVDIMTAESVMLTAVFIAESVDHANWETLSAMVPELPDGSVKDLLRQITEEIEQEEDEHYSWARDTRARMTMLQAKSSAMEKAGMKVEEMMAAVKSWFD